MPDTRDCIKLKKAVVDFRADLDLLPAPLLAPAHQLALEDGEEESCYGDEGAPEAEETEDEGYESEDGYVRGQQSGCTSFGMEWSRWGEIERHLEEAVRSEAARHPTAVMDDWIAAGIEAVEYCITSEAMLEAATVVARVVASECRDAQARAALRRPYSRGVIRSMPGSPTGGPHGREAQVE